MPSDLVVFSAIACEKVLLERDGVPSAIRLIDIVFVDPTVPPEKRPPFLIELLVQGRFKANVRRICTVNVDLIRTDGERIRMQSEEMPESQTPYAEAPSGFNWKTQVVLIPHNLGTAFIEVSLEKEDALVRVPVTFLPAPQPASE